MPKTHARDSFVSRRGLFSQRFSRRIATESWRAIGTGYDPTPARTLINIAPICQHPRACGKVRPVSAVSGTIVGVVDLEKYEVRVLEGDLDTDSFRRFGDCRIVAVDTETTGLDPTTDSLELVQLCGENVVALVRKPARDARLLRELLCHSSLEFVFHFARFDLAFLHSHSGTLAKNVVCTKIAARIVRSYGHQASLCDLVSQVFGHELDKSKEIRTSDWSASALSPRQLAYASQDVVWLAPLWHRLRRELEERGELEFAYSCFAAVKVIAEGDSRISERLFEHS